LQKVSDCHGSGSLGNIYDFISPSRDGSNEPGAFYKDLFSEMERGFFMTYHSTYTNDLNSDHHKNRSKISVCTAFNNPGFTISKIVLAMIQKLTSDLKAVKFRSKNLQGSISL